MKRIRAFTLIELLVVVGIIAINKTDHPISAAIQLSHAAGFQSAHIYCLTSAAPSLKPASSIRLKDSAQFTYKMPPFSASTLQLTRFKTSPR